MQMLRIIFQNFTEIDPVRVNKHLDRNNTEPCFHCEKRFTETGLRKHLLNVVKLGRICPDPDCGAKFKSVLITNHHMISDHMGEVFTPEQYAAASIANNKIKKEIEIDEDDDFEVFDPPEVALNIPGETDDDEEEGTVAEEEAVREDESFNPEVNNETDGTGKQATNVPDESN